MAPAEQEGENADVSEAASWSVDGASEGRAVDDPFMVTGPQAMYSGLV
jgi:hypothetical protein